MTTEEILATRADLYRKAFEGARSVAVPALDIALEHAPERFSFGTDWSVRIDGHTISNAIWSSVQSDKRDAWLNEIVGAIEDLKAQRDEDEEDDDE